MKNTLFIDQGLKSRFLGIIQNTPNRKENQYSILNSQTVFIELHEKVRHEKVEEASR
jgi:hypothetical protein